MKTHLYFILGFVVLLFLSCGESLVGGTEFGNPTGTVVIKGSVGSSGNTTSNLASYLTVEGTADTFKTRTYKISLGNSSDCSAASFVDIFDNTADTSDCVANPTDTSLFNEMVSGQVMASNASFQAGTYSCVKITMCDQLVWTTSNISQCSGTNYQDIKDPRDEAEVLTFYYSTTGENPDEDNESKDDGSIDKPFLLTETLTVTEGKTTTLLFHVSNSDTSDGMVATYNSENQEIYQCGVGAPEMTVIAE